MRGCWLAQNFSRALCTPCKAHTQRFTDQTFKRSTNTLLGVHADGAASTVCQHLPRRLPASIPGWAHGCPGEAGLGQQAYRWMQACLPHLPSDMHWGKQY